MSGPGDIGDSFQRGQLFIVFNVYSSYAPLKELEASISMALGVEHTGMHFMLRQLPCWLD